MLAPTPVGTLPPIAVSPAVLLPPPIKWAPGLPNPLWTAGSDPVDPCEAFFRQIKSSNSLTLRAGPKFLAGSGLFQLLPPSRI